MLFTKSGIAIAFKAFVTDEKIFKQAKAGISFDGNVLTILAKLPITSLPMVFDNRCSE